MDESQNRLSEFWNTLRAWIWPAAKILLVVAVVAAVVYWMRFSPVRVIGYEVEQGAIVAEVMGTGTLEADVQTTISAKISGRIESLLADQGDRVTAGQTLVKLDSQELQQQVEIAKASLEAAGAAVERLKIDRERALAVLEQAQRDFERVRQLAGKNAVTESELDKATESLAVAESGVAHANAAITEAEKEAIAAEKTLEYHRARLDDTEIEAPFDGLIVSRQRDLGDVVVPGSPILTLISTDRLWISAWVDETAIDEVEPRQEARVVFRSEPERSYPGRVVRLGREADRESREFVVDVEVLKLPENWAVGQRAEVYIRTASQTGATLLPAETVVWNEYEAGVYVHVDGHAQWRPVELGLRNQEMVEAVEGLVPGERVVVPADPKVRLSDGRRIAVP